MTRKKKKKDPRPSAPGLSFGAQRTAAAAPLPLLRPEERPRRGRGEAAAEREGWGEEHSRGNLAVCHLLPFPSFLLLLSLSQWRRRPSSPFPLARAAGAQHGPAAAARRPPRTRTLTRGQSGRAGEGREAQAKCARFEFFAVAPLCSASLLSRLWPPPPPSGAAPCPGLAPAPCVPGQEGAGRAQRRQEATRATQTGDGEEQEKAHPPACRHARGPAPRGAPAPCAWPACASRRSADRSTSTPATLSCHLRGGRGAEEEEEEGEGKGEGTPGRKMSEGDHTAIIAQHDCAGSPQPQPQPRRRCSPPCWPPSGGPCGGGAAPSWLIDDEAMPAVRVCEAPCRGRCGSGAQQRRPQLRARCPPSATPWAAQALRRARRQRWWWWWWCKGKGSSKARRKRGQARWAQSKGDERASGAGGGGAGSLAGGRAVAQCVLRRAGTTRTRKEGEAPQARARGEEQKGELEPKAATTHVRDTGQAARRPRRAGCRGGPTTRAAPGSVGLCGRRGGGSRGAAGVMTRRLRERETIRGPRQGRGRPLRAGAAMAGTRGFARQRCVRDRGGWGQRGEQAPPRGRAGQRRQGATDPRKTKKNGPRQQSPPMTALPPSPRRSHLSVRPSGRRRRPGRHTFARVPSETRAQREPHAHARRRLR